MRIRLSSILLTISLLLIETASAVHTIKHNNPPETLILKLTDESMKGWKELTKRVSATEVIAEWIPSNQTEKNWSELIAIQYLGKSILNQKGRNSVEKMVDQIRKTTTSAYPGNKVTWKTIYKTKNAIIYEWILHNQYKDIPPQNEIALARLTENGFHRVGFTRKNCEMDVLEKEKWIKLFKESVMLVPKGVALNGPEFLSVAECCKSSLDLGSSFKNWRIYHTYELADGNILISHLPPSQDGNHVTECMEVTSNAGAGDVSVDRLLATEKEKAQKAAGTSLKFQLIKNNPGEAIFAFSHPIDKLVITSIMRICTTKGGYHILNYKRGLSEEMKQEEINDWVKKLESISTEFVSNQKTHSLECVERIDDRIEIINVTEQWAKEMDVIDFFQADPGFTKWFIKFHDIPGNPPYSLQQKRLIQSDPDRFISIPNPSSESILESKNRSSPIGLMVSVRGYLPGEKVIIRLSAKDAYREIVFYPRPLLMKEDNRRLLAKATLLNAEPGHTLYTLDVCGIEKQEKYKLISRSGKEILSHNWQGPITCTISPEVVGQVKGVAKTVLEFEDGTSYSMELPWGYELLEYKRGIK